MDNRMSDVDYEGLDRLLGALAERLASRVHLDETALSESSSIPETLPVTWRDTATAVQVDTLPRGVALKTVVRGVLGHFLPAAAVAGHLGHGDRHGSCSGGGPIPIPIPDPIPTPGPIPIPI